mmetsp:Transcript_19319/g.34034  ORF Transcript_19319/g.34034 Transcript_19319/m.34034 type:complete len:105 (-) Transcript_19319:288-602(-)
MALKRTLFLFSSGTGLERFDRWLFREEWALSAEDPSEVQLICSPAGPFRSNEDDPEPLLSRDLGLPFVPTDLLPFVLPIERVAADLELWSLEVEVSPETLIDSA